MAAQSRIAALLPDKVFVRLIARVHRRFEPELGRLFAMYPGGGTFLDVGAWYGPWTTWFGRKAAEVVAFEPNPEVAEVLANAVPSHVRVVRAAASAIAGRATLTLPEGGRGTEGRASLNPLVAGHRSVEVTTTRIDDLALSDVRLVKIDVEGHELEALQGATDLLTAQHPVLAIELEERHGGIAPTVDLLAGLGYRGLVLVGGRWVGIDEFDLVAHQATHAGNAQRGYLANAMKSKDPYINNVVFVHPSSSWGPR